LVARPRGGYRIPFLPAHLHLEFHVPQFPRARRISGGSVTVSHPLMG